MLYADFLNFILILNALKMDFKCPTIFLITIPRIVVQLLGLFHSVFHNLVYSYLI